MTTGEIIGLSVALVIMLIGAVGSVLPALPGTPLILAAAAGHRIYFGAHSVNTAVLLCLFLLTLVAIALDYVATAYGAKRLGATWRGVVGAALGGIVGLFFGLPGIIVGPFLGATILEMIGGFEWKRASKAGLGATLGLIVSAVGKGALSLGMIALFTINVIVRS